LFLFKFCYGFRLREIDFVVEKRSLREFARLCASTADLNDTCDECLHDQRATVALQLEDMLPGVGVRRRKE